jgi:glucokinase
MSAAGAATGAIDIGGTKMAIALVDEHGLVLAREELHTRAARGCQVALEEVCAVMQRMLAQTGLRLAAIGIGCTGPVDPVSGVVGDVEFLPGWRGCNPVAHLSRQFRVPVALENDADAAVLAELMWGAGRGHKNLISVTVGTGIGGGIVVNGGLYRGAGGAHPEVGHHVIDASGPRCFCGANGCWESLASGPAMVRRFTASGASAGTGTDAVSALSICCAARAHDGAALHEIATEGRYLGIGLANLMALFIPDVIALSGSVMESADLLMPHIRGVLQQNRGLVPVERVTVATSPLGRDAPLIGAAAVGMHHRQGMLQC